jgi:hypothetical protein
MYCCRKVNYELELFVFCYCTLYKELAITKVTDADSLLHHPYVTLSRAHAQTHAHTHTHTHIHIYIYILTLHIQK